MTDQCFTWNLTPTERCIAEAAFGSVPNGKLRLRAHRASAAVLELRGSLDDVRCEHEHAMLAELRSEPENEALRITHEQAQEAFATLCETATCGVAPAATLQLYLTDMKRRAGAR